jgi:hypothetical protein
MTQEFRIPLKPEVASRKEVFDGVNKFISARGGWITSVPGAVDVTIEVMPGSSIPAEPRWATTSSRTARASA